MIDSFVLEYGKTLIITLYVTGILLVTNIKGHWTGIRGCGTNEFGRFALTGKVAVRLK